MHKLKIILAVMAIGLISFLPSPSFGEALSTLTSFVKTNASATVPVQLSSSSLKFRSATIYGLRDYQTTNTSTVYIGTSSTNGQQFIIVPVTNAVVIQPPAGFYYDFTNLWLDVVTANDGVVVTYDPL